MSLVHTLLFFIRHDHYLDDIEMAEKCLESLSKSAYKKIVIYNQGCLSNYELQKMLLKYNLEYFIIGSSVNVGIIAGRQDCFKYIWDNFPDTEYVSELHLDMIFPPKWENNLIDYLQQNDEPVICSGIINSCKQCVNLSEFVHKLPRDLEDCISCLIGLKKDLIVPGFTHPCIHVMKILKEVGGFDLGMFKGSQCYEDDSLLLSYYLYYGTKANWYPKINYNSVVYHGCATQRLGLDITIQNYIGLLRQYGIMGQKYLSILHSNPAQKSFFEKQYELLKEGYSNHI